MGNYLLLNEAFCTLNTGYSTPSGMFNFAITIDGDYVCALQTLTDLPELFEGELLIPGITPIALDVSDFPLQPRN